MRSLKCVILLTSLLIGYSAYATSESEGVVKSACVVDNPSTSNLYMATKWYRDSSEQRAIYLQTYRMAYDIIKNNVKSKKLKPNTWGIVMDIDETVLDNSSYQVSLINKCQTDSFSPQSWNDFVNKQISTATPGAVEFTNKIHKLGGVINFVSGRTENLRNATVSNLDRYGIKYNQIILASPETDGMNKNQLFLAIEKGVAPSKITHQKIIAYFGDNIQDFPNSKQSEMITKPLDSEAYAEFGRKYFVLPNPTYGTWPKNQYK